MHDVTVKIKELHLHDMVGAWVDLMAQGDASTASSRWLIGHLLQAEIIWFLCESSVTTEEDINYISVTKLTFIL